MSNNISIHHQSAVFEMIESVQLALIEPFRCIKLILGSIHDALGASVLVSNPQPPSQVYMVIYRTLCHYILLFGQKFLLFIGVEQGKTIYEK